MNRRRALAGLAALPLTTGRGRAMGGFAEAITGSMPPGLDLPEAFVITIDWLEQNNFVRNGRTAFVKPADAPLTSELGFKAVDIGHVSAWLGTSDPAVVHRLAPIIPTGGDGSHAALWRRDDGGLSVVHLGSGSGSTLMSTLAEDPVDMLRLMAIGYAELCWPETFAVTPEEEHAALVASVGPDILPPYTPPTLFRHFVAKTFSVTIPQTASEIVSSVALMESQTSDDAFWQWVQTVPRT